MFFISCFVSSLVACILPGRLYFGRFAFFSLTWFLPGFFKYPLPIYRDSFIGSISSISSMATKKLHPLSRRAVTYICLQVSWLMGPYPLPSRHFCQWLPLKDTTPIYSGGTAPVFNWIPFTSRWIFSCQRYSAIFIKYTRKNKYYKRHFNHGTRKW